MKKRIIIAFLAAAALFAVPVSAATTEQDIINEIKAGVQVGSKVKMIPEKYIDVAQKFFDANDLTEAELTAALADLKEAKQIWAETGETEFKNIPVAKQDQLMSKAAASAKKVGATLAFDGKTISVVDKSGKAYNVLAKSNPFQTAAGANTTGVVLLSAAALCVLAVLVFVSRRFSLTGVRRAA